MELYIAPTTLFLSTDLYAKIGVGGAGVLNFIMHKLFNSKQLEARISIDLLTESLCISKNTAFKYLNILESNDYIIRTTPEGMSKDKSNVNVKFGDKLNFYFNKYLSENDGLFRFVDEARNQEKSKFGTCLPIVMYNIMSSIVNYITHNINNQTDRRKFISLDLNENFVQTKNSDLSTDFCSEKSLRDFSEPALEENRNLVCNLLLENHEIYPVCRDKKFEEYMKIYNMTPASLEKEFLKMNAWLENNPTRRKTRRGIGRFISSWLEKRANNFSSITNQKKKSFTKSKRFSLNETVMELADELRRY